jgi:hypothetical protein
VPRCWDGQDTMITLKLGLVNNKSTVLRVSPTEPQ